MAVLPTVKSGDYLGLIAERHGLTSWRDIYYCPDDAAFRLKRPDPDKIFPESRLGYAGPNAMPLPASRKARAPPVVICSLRPF